MLSTFMKITRVNSGAPDIHFFPGLHSTSLVCILLVWSANGNAPFQGKFQVNLLKMTILTDGIVRRHPIRTNRVRCTLNMEILDLLNEESVSGARSGRASL